MGVDFLDTLGGEVGQAEALKETELVYLVDPCESFGDGCCWVGSVDVKAVDLIPCVLDG